MMVHAEIYILSSAGVILLVLYLVTPQFLIEEVDSTIFHVALLNTMVTKNYVSLCAFMSWMLLVSLDVTFDKTNDRLGLLVTEIEVGDGTLYNL